MKKRRRWYAVTLGAIVATTMLTILLIREGWDENDEYWVIPATWGILFLLHFVAGYTVWYSPFSERLKAVLLSIIAAFFALAPLYAFIAIQELYYYGYINIRNLVATYVDIQIFTLGIPYIAAAIVGWCFARPAPDVRESF